MILAGSRSPLQRTSTVDSEVNPNSVTFQKNMQQKLRFAEFSRKQLKCSLSEHDSISKTYLPLVIESEKLLIDMSKSEDVSEFFLTMRIMRNGMKKLNNNNNDKENKDQ